MNLHVSIQVLVVFTEYSINIISDIQTNWMEPFGTKLTWKHV